MAASYGIAALYPAAAAAAAAPAPASAVLNPLLTTPFATPGRPPRHPAAHPRREFLRSCLAGALWEPGCVASARRSRRPRGVRRRVSELENPDRDSEDLRSRSTRERTRYSNQRAHGNTSNRNASKASVLGPLPFSKPVEETLSNPKFEITTAALVIISIVVVAFQTLPEVSGDLARSFDKTEDLICIFFALEYLARWYSKQLNPIYILRPLAIIDLLSFSPLVLKAMLLAMDLKMSFLGGTGQEFSMRAEAEESLDAAPLIFLKLLRIIRLQRFLIDFETFRDLEIALGLKPSQIRPYQLQLARVILSLFTLYFVSAGLIYVTESGVNPDIQNFFAAMYFGLTTLTTVGFGDIAPVTAEGRLVVCLSIIVGVAIIPVQLGSLAEAFMQDTAQNMSKSSSLRSEHVCGACGASPHEARARFCWQCGRPLKRENDEE